MISAELQKAIDSLKIQDVYVRDLLANCADGFDPKYNDGVAQLDVQMMHLVRKSDIIEFNESHQLLRVFVRMGVRWVSNADKDIENSDGENDEKGDSEDDELLALASIEAEFVAEYRITAELEKACFDEFALKNASYHVWPYWRELLTNQCSRMHLPRVVLPAIQLADNRHQQSESLEKPAEEVTEDK